MASTVPCFKPGNQKKHTKPTRPVKKYLLEGGLQKKTNKTTVDGPPLPGEDQWRAGMFDFTFTFSWVRGDAPKKKPLLGLPG